jgi:hypothetical protein
MSFTLGGRTFATATEKFALLMGHGWSVKEIHLDETACTLRAVPGDGAPVDATVTSDDMEERERQQFAQILPGMLRSRCIHKLYKAVALVDRSLGEC